MFKTLFCILAIAGIADEIKPENEVVKISEAMGHLIGKNLQSLGLNVDLNAVVKGLQDASQGKESPLSEEECVQAIAALQEEALTTLSEKNLQEANSFLEKNKKEEKIVSLEEGKLQYRIEKSGLGKTVESYNSPLVEYKVNYLNGATLGASNGDEMIDLDEVIPGFKKGIIGMKEGEERTLYIHPELGYGKQEGLNPNSLLIFQVKVIKADASAEAHAASNSEHLPKTLSPAPEEAEEVR